MTSTDMTLRVNWSLYYREFSRVHGGSPVLYREDKETGKGGYWLFRDGWMYSRYDVKGPEYAPQGEEDQRKKIKSYWAICEKVLSHELANMEEHLLSLSREQDMRSAPLMTVEQVIVEDDMGNRAGRENRNVPIDFDLLIAQVQELRDRVEECKREMTCEAAVVDFMPQRTTELKVLTELQLLKINGSDRHDA